MPASAKNTEIEALRGIAVSLAILTHLAVLLPFHTESLLRAYNTIAMPGTGVDLFFCISGFIVSRAFLEWFDELRAQGNFALSIQAFWIRRFSRLMPTAMLWVFVGTICAAFFNRTGVFGPVFENLRSATSILTATGNFGNYYGLLLRPNEIYWSLALEQQFYFLFPFFLALIPKRWRAGVVVAGILLQLPIARTVHIAAPASNHFMASLRTDSIFWGILVFLLSRTRHYQQLEPWMLKHSRGAKAVATGLLLYLLVAMPAQFPLLPVTMGLVAAVSGAIVFLASYQQGYTTPFEGLGKIFAWIGARSYSIYIIHMLCYRLTFEAWSRYATVRGAPLGVADTVPMLLSAAAVLLLLTQLNHHFVELPLRNRGARMAAQRLREYQSGGGPAGA